MKDLSKYRKLFKIINSILISIVLFVQVVWILIYQTWMTMGGDIWTVVFIVITTFFAIAFIQYLRTSNLGWHNYVLSFVQFLLMLYLVINVVSASMIDLIWEQIDKTAIGLTDESGLEETINLAAPYLFQKGYLSFVPIITQYSFAICLVIIMLYTSYLVIKSISKYLNSNLPLKTIIVFKGIAITLIFLSGLFLIYTSNTVAKYYSGYLTFIIDPTNATYYEDKDFSEIPYSDQLFEISNFYELVESHEGLYYNVYKPSYIIPLLLITLLFVWSVHVLTSKKYNNKITTTLTEI